MYRLCGNEHYVISIAQTVDVTASYAYARQVFYRPHDVLTVQGEQVWWQQHTALQNTSFDLNWRSKLIFNPDVSWLFPVHVFNDSEVFVIYHVFPQKVDDVLMLDGIKCLGIIYKAEIQVLLYFDGSLCNHSEDVDSVPRAFVFNDFTLLLSYFYILKIYTVCVCIYIYIINIHSKHTYKM